MAAPYSITVSFGDCDPAGIVFYPNTFRWMDAAFHAQLRAFGGHERICRDLGAIGLGLIDASAAFQSPLCDGDRLDLETSFTRWGRKSFTVQHRGLVGDRLAFTGQEVRGVFTRTDAGLISSGIDRLRAILEPGVR